MPKPAQDVPGSRSIRDHIINVAGELFYGRGIRAVGVDEIIAEADIARATLYRHFTGKEDIIVSYLEQRKALLEAAFLEYVEREGETPKGKVLSVFDGLVRNLQAPSFRGCAFLMAVAEHGDLPRVKDAARAYKLFLRDQFRSILCGEVPDAAALTEQLLLVYEGAIATAVLRPESNPGAHALRTAERLLREP